jgi:putative ABC transport system ATP-binding protein
MSTVIVTQGLKKVYHLGLTELPALRGIDLRVEEGEFVAFMGASGSGKSTLLHILGCLDEPSEGSYYLEGGDVSRLSNQQRARIRNQRIGFVFQNFNLLPRMDALENTALPLFYTGQPDGWQERAALALQRVGLSQRMHHRPMELSGGERQRVAIARALITAPALILADEPTGNLDSVTGEEILSLLKELNRGGRTLLMVTHDAHVASYAGRLVTMRDGRLLEDR